MKKSKGSLVVSFILLAVSVVIAGRAVVDKVRLNAIERDGVTVPGSIHEGQEMIGKRGKRTGVKFKVSWKSPAGEQIVRDLLASMEFAASHFQAPSTVTNDVVQVRYLPSDPARAILIGDKNDHLWSSLGAAVIAALAGGGLLFVYKRSQPVS